MKKYSMEKILKTLSEKTDGQTIREDLPGTQHHGVNLLPIA